MRIGYVLYSDTGSLDLPGIKDILGLDTKNVMHLAGANLGNFAFKYAASYLFEDEITLISYQTPIEEIKARCDVIVMPEANIVNPGVNYAAQADLIESLDMPCFLLGVGAQAKSFEDAIQIPEGTIRFLKAVESRTSKICVRGKYTAEKLNELGIKKVEITGCPALMLNPSRHLWQKVKLNYEKELFFNNMVVTEGVYPLASRNDNIDAIEKFLFSNVVFGDAEYVCQTQTSVLAYGLNKYENINFQDVKFLKSYLAPYISEEQFIAIARDKFKAFTDIPSWITNYKNKSGIIGTRIHGSLLGFQAERPALPIAHDTRTQELCETMRLPHSTASEVANNLSHVDLANLIESKYQFNSEHLDAHRSSIALNYISLIQEVNLCPSKHIKHIANID